MAQIAYTKTEPRTIPGPLENDMDIHEDYHGSFKVAQSLDSYGEGLLTQRAQMEMDLLTPTRDRQDSKILRDGQRRLQIG